MSVEEVLRATLAAVTGDDSPIEHLTRLSGGANMESSAFVHAGEAYVLRRAPGGGPIGGGSIDHATEAALVRAVHSAGVTAPEVVAELDPEDGLGTGYVMRRVEGDVDPRTLLADPSTGLLTSIAREVAAIHAVPLDDLPPLPAPTASELVADLRRQLEDHGADRPVIALAVRWLEDHLPDPAPLVLVHGDLRVGNVMARDGVVTAVLDWELAHLGDAHQDLAYGCIGSWRFGHVDRPGLGLGSLEEWTAAYEAAGGAAVDPDRLRFWLVYSTTWWALCCLEMGAIWRRGDDRALERAVIGRRTSEAELDALLLLEEDVDVDAPVDPPPTAEAAVAGEPTTAELLEALADWARGVRDESEGRARFEAAVAGTALGMLRREAETPIDPRDPELAADLLAGRADLTTPGVLARLRRTAWHKLAIDQPRYGSLAVAAERWAAPNPRA